jgi:uroporphyrinogen-III synthase
MGQGEIAAVLLASPSAVEGFIAQAGHLLPALSGASFVAIGGVTADAMLAAGLPVHAMPQTPGADTMVEALAAYLWGNTVDERGDGSQT